MKTILAIIAITLVIACSLESDEGGTGTNPSSSSNRTTQSSSSGQSDKNYTVTVSNGVSCTIMIRKNNSGYSSSIKYTLQCPSGTKIGCMRFYDDSNFIVGTRSIYGSLVAADGYGVGDITCDFDSIASVSLHETYCN